MQSVPIIGAAYARYSTDLQHETSIAAQLQGITVYCAQHNIVLPYAPYVDMAQTGVYADRDGFQRLLADAAAHKFQAVVIYDVTRSNRDVGDWFNFRRAMDQLGVAVHSVTNTLGKLDDPDSFLSELITVGIGQHQVLQSRQKSIAGKRISASRGLFCGGVAPLGYDIVDQHYVINEREAPVVRMAFEMYAAGRSYSSIIAAMQRAGVVGRSGTLTPTGLHDLFCNPRYIGRYIWFAREERHMHRHVGRPGDAIIIEDAIPAIIDKKLWEDVQMRIEENRKNKMNHARPDREYLLSGLVFCADCGSLMIGMTTTARGHEYKRYICQNKKKLHTCSMKDVNGDDLEVRAYELIRDRLLCPETIDAMVDDLYVRMADRPDDTAAVRGELTSVNAKIARLMAAIEDGLSTSATIERVNALQQRKEALVQQLTAHAAAQLPPRDIVRDILLADAQRFLDDPAARKDLYRKYINAIVVSKDTIEFQIAPFGMGAEKNRGHRPVQDFDHGKLLRYVLPRSQNAA